MAPAPVGAALAFWAHLCIGGRASPHSDSPRAACVPPALPRKLRASSKDIPDPYVSLILLPDKNRVTKRKTTVRKRTLNPEFNER